MHVCGGADGLNSAGATPYSLHNLDAPSGYEAKEFHLQQVHKPLPDKVSAYPRCYWAARDDAYV